MRRIRNRWRKRMRKMTWRRRKWWRWRSWKRTRRMGADGTGRGGPGREKRGIGKGQRAGASATVLVFGDSQNPSLLVKLLLTGVDPCGSHCSSLEQRGKVWLTKSLRTCSSKRRSVQMLSPNSKEITLAE